MSIISYAGFLANAQAADILALSILAQGIVVKTQDPVEADAYEAQCERLFQPGVECLVRFQRGKERDSSGNVWHTFEGRVDPVAANYVAKAASERVHYSREEVPTTP